MSNQQNDTYYETIYEIIEENAERKEHSARRIKGKPFNTVMDIDNMVYKSILNLNK